MTGFTAVSIKDNYLLLSPKLRRKETSGDVHLEDTRGPRERVAEGPVLWGNLPLLRSWLPGRHQARVAVLPADGQEKTTAGHRFCSWHTG